MSNRAFSVVGLFDNSQQLVDAIPTVKAKVPAGRGCTVIDVVRAIRYVIEQEYETGQAVPVTGGQVMLR